MPSLLPLVYVPMMSFDFCAVAKRERNTAGANKNFFISNRLLMTLFVVGSIIHRNFLTVVENEL